MKTMFAALKEAFGTQIERWSFSKLAKEELLNQLIQILDKLHSEYIQPEELEDEELQVLIDVFVYNFHSGVAGLDAEHYKMIYPYIKQSAKQGYPMAMYL